MTPLVFFYFGNESRIGFVIEFKDFLTLNSDIMLRMVLMCILLNITILYMQLSMIEKENKQLIKINYKWYDLPLYPLT